MSQQSAPDRDVASAQPRGRHHALDIGRFGIGQRAEDTRHRTLGELGRQFGGDQSPAPRNCQQGHPVFHVSKDHSRLQIPDAKATVDKEWEKLEKNPAWQLTEVRNKKEVIDETRIQDQKEEERVVSKSRPAVMNMSS